MTATIIHHGTLVGVVCVYRQWRSLELATSPRRRLWLPASDRGLVYVGRR